MWNYRDLFFSICRVYLSTHYFYLLLLNSIFIRFCTVVIHKILQTGAIYTSRFSIVFVNCIFTIHDSSHNSQARQKILEWFHPEQHSLRKPHVKLWQSSTSTWIYVNAVKTLARNIWYIWGSIEGSTRIFEQAIRKICQSSTYSPLHKMQQWSGISYDEEYRQCRWVVSWTPGIWKSDKVIFTKSDKAN